MHCAAHHPLQVLLGSRTLPYEAIEGRADLEASASGYVPWRAVWAAIESYSLRLVDQVGPGALTSGGDACIAAETPPLPVGRQIAGCAAPGVCSGGTPWPPAAMCLC